MVFFSRSSLPSAAPKISAAVDAQPLAEDRGANGLWQQLQRLHTWASMMMIVAHPDDEDGGMLTYESRGLGVRTSLMTLTRGEGGQNVMSSDADDALGLIRTNELLKADEYYGVEQYWGRVADYGFSKTIEEAFQQWGHERVLYDVVRAVRINRPLVITASFIGGITDGHGQHQVSGEMAQEVFTAAGDPNVFPDQIKAGLRPWSPLKVYARVPNYSIGKEGMFDYATGKWAPVRFYNYVSKEWSTSAPATNVVVPEGSYDPLLGRTYVQISRQGWGFQKTQNGGGYIVLPGEVNSDYHRYGSRVKSSETETSFFDGVDTSLSGIASLAHGDTGFLKTGLQTIGADVEKAMTAYDPAAPAKIAPALHDGYLATKKLIADVKSSSLSEDDKANVDWELERKLDQFNSALAEALGLQIDALTTPGKSVTQASIFSPGVEDTRAAATPGSDVYVRLRLLNASALQKSAPKLVKTWVTSPVDAASSCRTAGCAEAGCGDRRCALPGRHCDERERNAAVFQPSQRSAGVLQHRWASGEPGVAQRFVRALSAARMGRVRLRRRADSDRAGRADSASVGRDRVGRRSAGNRAGDLGRHPPIGRCGSSGRRRVPSGCDGA